LSIPRRLFAAAHNALPPTEFQRFYYTVENPLSYFGIF
jgi:hypothetical protein